MTSNVPDSYRTGIELLAGVRIVRCLEWNGNLTISRNKIQNYTNYTSIDGEVEQVDVFYKSTNIPYSPNVIANSLFLFKYKSFNAGLQSSYVGKQYLDNTSSDNRSIDAYFVNNLRLGYDFKIKGLKQLSVALLINNLFNEEYESNGWAWSEYYRNEDGGLELSSGAGYYPQAGTNVMANLSITF